MACPTNYALQLHKKAAATGNTCHTTTPRTAPLFVLLLPATKLELTFLKLNESAVSGKWISNICLKNILQKNEKKAQRKKRKLEAKITAKIRLKYASGCLPRPQPLELFPQDVRA